MLGWLADHDIDPHIPVWDKSEGDDGTFMRADFTYDEDSDLYICPAGKPLTKTGRMSDGKTIYYRASKLDCDPCPFKSKCCPKSPERRLSRDINEAARDYTRALMETEACPDPARIRYGEFSRDRDVHDRSDGVIDQIGGERRRSFGRRRFRELLITCQGSSMADQQDKIRSALAAFQADESRRDDVSVVGFQVR